MTILHWIVSIISILVASYLVQGVHIDSLLTAAVLAIVLGIINVFLKPVIKILTLPINILTLGIFSLFVNALMVELASLFVHGFAIDNFWSAFFFAIIISLINALFAIGHKKELVG